MPSSNVGRCGGNGNRCTRTASSGARRAMSLLEVILAIAILAGTLAILGEIIRAGARAGRSTSKLSSAQLMCESLLAEITAGTAPPESTEGEQADENGDTWTYSVQVEQAGQEGMLAVVVTVQESATDNAVDPVTFSLVRWMVDPQLEADMESAAQETDSANEATDSSSSDSNSDTSSGSSSGAPTGGGSAPPGGGSR